MRSTHPIAKITCPASTGNFPRHRLYRLLDKARKAPVLWITGPPVYVVRRNDNFEDLR